jgi:hypothetical protein
MKENEEAKLQLEDTKEKLETKNKDLDRERSK